MSPAGPGIELTNTSARPSASAIWASCEGRGRFPTAVITLACVGAPSMSTSDAHAAFGWERDAPAPSSGHAEANGGCGANPAAAQSGTCDAAATSSPARVGPISGANAAVP